MHCMRFGVCAAETLGVAFWPEWRAILGNVVWVGSLCGCVWIPDLAAVYVPVSACGRAAHSIQPSVSGDVWGRSRTDVGRAEILHLFFPVRRGRGNHQRDREVDYRSARARQRLGADDWSVRRDLWNSSGLRGADAAPASVGVSAARYGIDANFCGGDGSD